MLARSFETVGCFALAEICVLACSVEPNYLDPTGPRYSADHADSEPTTNGTLRVVSYNLENGREIETAIVALQAGPLADADLILMQEMDPSGVDRIAAALRLRYVYYPASFKSGRDWGNAVLSRWPLLADHKVLLPHADPYSDTRRIAVAAEVDVAGRSLMVYSTHIATATLGLGARLDQVETILQDAGTGAAVVGGDFNTESGSPDQLLQLCAEYGFAWASQGAHNTESHWGFDQFTLDYVFARQLSAADSGTFRGRAGSDHRPIWVDLSGQ